MSASSGSIGTDMQADARERRAARRFGAVTLLVTLAWLVVFAYAVHPALPFDPLRLPFERWVYGSFWAPEGWGFFTRDPREERVEILGRGADGSWRVVSHGPNARPANLFGLRRTARAETLELGLLLASVPRTAWSACDGDPRLCLEGTVSARGIVNHLPAPRLCGALGLVRQKPVPWAWQAGGAQVVMPSHVVRLEVECSSS